IATTILQMLKPVIPLAPTRSNRKPPTSAPMIPSAILSQKPWPLLIDDSASNKTRNQTEYDPADDAHVSVWFARTQRLLPNTYRVFRQFVACSRWFIAIF